MKNTLIIYPTFLCPFACNFCSTKNKNSVNEIMEIPLLKEFLTNHSSKFDRIVVSGGEPMTFQKAYFDSLIDTIKEFNEDITILSYPILMDNYREDVKYSLSYDFLARSRAMEVWNNLINFPKEFDLKLTLSPVLFKYHPNLIFKKLTLLSNCKTVELLPYYKSDSTFFGITTENTRRYYQSFLSSELQVPFININKEKIKFQNNLPTSITFEDENEYCLMPNCSLAINNFIGDTRIFSDITIDDVGTATINYPDTIDLYDSSFVQWVLK